MANSASRRPPLIAQPVDSCSKEYRRNCHAWHLLCTLSRDELLAWLDRQKPRAREDMRARLNQLREQMKAMRELCAEQMNVSNKEQ